MRTSTISSSPRALGLQRAGAGGGGAVEDVDAGDGEARLRPRRLLLEGEDAAVGVELDHAVALGVGDVVAEDGSALGARAGALQEERQVVAEEDVVAEDHGRGAAFEEVLGEDVGLGEALGARLGDVVEAHPPLAAVPEQAAELLLVLGGGDDGDLAEAGEHQDRQRVVDHRLVVERQELLGERVGDGIEPGARPAGEHDPLAPAHASAASSSAMTPSSAGRQSGGRCRRRSAMAAQSRTEFAGRTARVGHSPLAIAVTFGRRAPAAAGEDRLGELGPADRGGAGIVEDPCPALARRPGGGDRPERRGDVAGPGRAAALVADHAHLVAGAAGREHGAHEVPPVRGRRPRRCAGSRGPGSPPRPGARRRACSRRRR